MAHTMCWLLLLLPIAVSRGAGAASLFPLSIDPPVGLDDRYTARPAVAANLSIFSLGNGYFHDVYGLNATHAMGLFADVLPILRAQGRHHCPNSSCVEGVLLPGPCACRCLHGWAGAACDSEEGRPDDPRQAGDPSSREFMCPVDHLISNALPNATGSALESIVQRRAFCTTPQCLLVPPGRRLGDRRTCYLEYLPTEYLGDVSCRRRRSGVGVECVCGRYAQACSRCGAASVMGSSPDASARVCHVGRATPAGRVGRIFPQACRTTMCCRTLDHDPMGCIRRGCVYSGADGRCHRLEEGCAPPVLPVGVVGGASRVTIVGGNAYTATVVSQHRLSYLSRIPVELKARVCLPWLRVGANHFDFNIEPLRAVSTSGARLEYVDLVDPRRATLFLYPTPPCASTYGLLRSEGAGLSCWSGSGFVQTALEDWGLNAYQHGRIGALPRFCAVIRVHDMGPGPTLSGQQWQFFPHAWRVPGVLSGPAPDTTTACTAVVNGCSRMATPQDVSDCVGERISGLGCDKRAMFLTTSAKFDG